MKNCVNGHTCPPLCVKGIVFRDPVCQKKPNPKFTKSAPHGHPNKFHIYATTQLQTEMPSNEPKWLLGTSWHWTCLLCPCAVTPRIVYNSTTTFAWCHFLWENANCFSRNGCWWYEEVNLLVCKVAVHHMVRGCNLTNFFDVIWYFACFNSPLDIILLAEIMQNSIAGP